MRPDKAIGRIAGGFAVGTLYFVLHHQAAQLQSAHLRGCAWLASYADERTLWYLGSIYRQGIWFCVWLEEVQPHMQHVHAVGVCTQAVASRTVILVA